MQSHGLVKVTQGFTPEEPQVRNARLCLHTCARCRSRTHAGVNLVSPINQETFTKDAHKQIQRCLHARCARGSRTRTRPRSERARCLMVKDERQQVLGGHFLPGSMCLQQPERHLERSTASKSRCGNMYCSRWKMWSSWFVLPGHVQRPTAVTVHASVPGVTAHGVTLTSKRQFLKCCFIFRYHPCFQVYS